jgi:hypothetical protein
LRRRTDKTIVIPGQGKSVSNRAELKEFRNMLVAIRESVAVLKKQGGSRDETVAAKPTAAFDAKWGVDPGFFTRLVYGFNRPGVKASEAIIQNWWNATMSILPAEVDTDFLSNAVRSRRGIASNEADHLSDGP